ncbi:MAG: AbrB/MazE/SpoVT family DNA-binding domain-containing protein [Hyphomicrobiaceae bacterium]
MKLELKRIGNSTGLILPKDLLARLGLDQGDAVAITEVPGGFKVSKYDETFAKGLAIARQAMKTYRNALKELAK